MYKKNDIFSILIFVPVVFSYMAISAEDVFATVGGPTYLERLSYSPSENAIYYLINNQGGRGCPAEIAKINLTTKEQILILPCDKIEETYYTNEGFNSLEYERFVQNTFQPLISLPIISLPKNGISITVDYVGEHRFDEYNVSSDFRALVSQGNEKKGTIDFLGCYKDQPNVFRGYMIPNTDKIAMVVSRIGDCFEGGYTDDDMYIVENIISKDTTPIAYHNNFSGPQVREGYLVVSTQNVDTILDSLSGKTQKIDFILVVAISTLIIGVGFGAGYAVGHKTKARSL